MKFEIVVIPVSDVDRAKEFYARLGWRLDADYDSGKDFRVIQFTPPGSGCSVIFGKNVTAAAPGSAQGLYLIVSDIEAARESCSQSRRRGQRSVPRRRRRVRRHRTSPTCLGGSGSAVRIPSIAATARSLRSAIPTATAGCSRRSRRGCPAASTPRQPPSHPQAIWRAHFAAPRPPTASTRSARRPARRELARLVRRVHGGRAVRQRAAAINSWYRRRAAQPSSSKTFLGGLPFAVFAKGGLFCLSIF